MNIKSSRPRKNPPQEADPNTPTTTHHSFGFMRWMTVTLFGLALLCATLARTGNLPASLSHSVFAHIPAKKAVLSNDALSSTAANWIPRHIAEAREFDKWCRRVDAPDCKKIDTDHRASRAFQDEFKAMRASAIAALEKVRISEASLIEASLENAHLVGAEFSDVDLTGANLDNAVLEEARLERAILNRATFKNADMRHAYISFENLNSDKVNMSEADLRGATLVSEGLTSIDLSAAKMQGVKLQGSFALNLEDVNLENVELVGSLSALLEAEDLAKIAFTKYPKLKLQNSWLKNPSRAIRGQKLWEGYLFQQENGKIVRRNRYLELNGTAIENVDFREAKSEKMATEPLAMSWKRVLRNTMAYANYVQLPPEAKAPCQWVKFDYDPERFVAAWRAWLERGNQPWPPFPGLDKPETVFGNDTRPLVLNFANIPADPSLLPPKSECDWVND